MVLRSQNSNLFPYLFESSVDVVRKQIGLSMVLPFMVIVVSILNEFVDGQLLVKAFLPACGKFVSAKVLCYLIWKMAS